MLKKSAISLILSFILTAIIGCFGGGSAGGDSNLIEINYPLNKTTVYAYASYVDEQGMLELDYLDIYSYHFNNYSRSGDTIFLQGVIQKFTPAFVIDNANTPNTQSGEIHLSIDTSWVLYQYSDLVDAFNIFIKPGSIDTLNPPTDLQNHFPIFPRSISPNSVYEVVRPGNPPGWLGVYRRFESADFMNWSDAYGSGRGISMRVEHGLLELPFETYFYLLTDAHGIIISQLSFVAVDDVGGGENGDETGYLITRRIVDFADPEIINPLSFYADMVAEQGMIPLHKDEVF